MRNSYFLDLKHCSKTRFWCQMRTLWWENEIFSLYKFGTKSLVLKHGGWNKEKHQLEKQIYNSFIQLDNYLVLKLCQNGLFRSKILVPNENFLVQKRNTSASNKKLIPFRNGSILFNPQLGNCQKNILLASQPQLASP